MPRRRFAFLATAMTLLTACGGTGDDLSTRSGTTPPRPDAQAATGGSSGPVTFPSWTPGEDLDLMSGLIGTVLVEGDCLLLASGDGNAQHRMLLLLPVPGTVWDGDAFVIGGTRVLSGMEITVTGTALGDLSGTTWTQESLRSTFGCLFDAVAATTTDITVLSPPSPSD